MPNARFSYALPGDPSCGNLRAWRRHHKARMQARAVAIHVDYSSQRGRNPSITDGTAVDQRIAYRLEMARKYGDNIAKCSCIACGNPRKVETSAMTRLTVQEQRVVFEYLQTVRVGVAWGDDTPVFAPASASASDFVCQEV